ncbi:hypothetical protein [Segniliparus rugosus]|uniref:Lipoprotein n=1 Tax=Segniliparus rugosus (strain ATCC BAA-974 / DSM 45345 / CCUG 50838 / CIP 108380 / JCM 13579 / CDC 945) TaxID=679197 RepID=E5XPX3_SEGRC|nr:hypothetical protein [Segniliparus rugosus]EFV13603.2 hypothetical protein HMPREF9336_01545 [Segniliparus rugosus ATCC BAA-974]
MKHLPGIAALALTGVLALSGCERSGGNGGTTTIIQQAPAASSTPNTPASVKATPLNDPRELCHQERILMRKLYAAVEPYWKLMVDAHGKSVNDPQISAAADKVIKVSEEVVPQLEGLVGPNAPADVAGPIKDYIAATKALVSAISEGAPGDEQTPLASKFGTATDEMDKVCKL